MPRTTEVAVKKIIEVDTISVPSLDPFIESANMLVTRHCATVTTDAAELELVERWLAAHFYAQRDPRLSSESISGPGGSLAASYQSRLGLNLANTHYGQQAMMLDSSGLLGKFNKDVEEGKKANIVANGTWMGRLPCP